LHLSANFETVVCSGPWRASSVAGQRTGFHWIGSRVETRRFQAFGKLNSTCTAPPGSSRTPSCPGRPGSAAGRCSPPSAPSSPRRSGTSCLPIYESKKSNQEISSCWIQVTGYRLQVLGLQPGGFKLLVKLHSTACTAPRLGFLPPHRLVVELVARARAAGGRSRRRGGVDGNVVGRHRGVWGLLVQRRRGHPIGRVGGTFHVILQ
jgi:hypothetical protein